ncbi:phage tail assembly protein [Tianweitania sediminis]|uniref:Phage tail assembly protein n=1 Tax=Tianweitania sediminis TaxID=1502156 RepID=A0A8J7UJ17_9HYPH|nr:phage tail assembly protein [Tianweitania sediminis]MBP0438390.1 phage tail assembly protein [Tianweitania sediminis]
MSEINLEEAADTQFVNDDVSEETSGAQEDAAQIFYDQVPATAVVRLAYPFEVDGVRISEVEFRHPSFSTVEAVLAGSLSELDLHSSMTGLSVTALRALRWPDLELVSVIARHLAPSMKRV